MKYNILKDFKGSPDGCFAVQYTAGTTVELTDSLAKVALEEKWAKVSKADKAEANAKAEAEAAAEEQAKAQARDAAIAALTAEIAQIEADYKAAADDAKPAIQTAWEAKQAELAAL